MLLRRLGLRLVRSSTFAELSRQADRLAQVLARTDDRGPVGAAPSLGASPTRLEEIRKATSDGATPALSPSQWDDGYVRAEVDLERFRADGGFVWQHRDHNLAIHHLVTQLHLGSIDSLGLLDRLEEDGAFGCETHVGADGKLVSRDLLDSVSEILFLERSIGISSIPHLGVLDIGAGYGRLAHRMHESLPNLASYLCADAVPEATYVAERYLQHRGISGGTRAVTLDRLDAELAATPAQLAVNIHSFTECPLTAIEWWLDLVARHGIRFLLIVPNAEQHVGSELHSKELDGRRADFRPALERRGFELLVEEPKYGDEAVQRFGVSPTRRYLFELRGA